MGAPELLFVGHGAERSGPPIYLANLLGCIANHPFEHWAAPRWFRRDGSYTNW